MIIKQPNGTSAYMHYSGSSCIPGIIKPLILLLLIIFVQSASAQNAFPKFGKCTQEELDLKECAFEPDAEAVVLYDIGEISFAVIGGRYQTIYTRRLKVKVFTKAGLDFAEFSIPYYKGSEGNEKIMHLQGNTYNLENGKLKISELNTKNAYDEMHSEHYFYKKFAMPDVKEGSVFEISYDITSPYITFLPSWKFQTSVPVMYSEYVAVMNPYFEYTFLLRGAGKFDEFEKSDGYGTAIYIGTIPYHDIKYKYVMKNLPVFKDESFITSPDDYLVKLDFQLSAIHYADGSHKSYLSTWPKLCDELIGEDSFGGFIKDCEKKGDEIMVHLNLDALSALDKAKGIDHFVKSGFSYNGRNSFFASGSLKELLINRTGNCADLNLLMAGLMKSAGLDVRPVILSTRDNGKIQTTYPFADAFNYVIVLVKIDSSLFLFDATEPLCKLNEIPTRCLNDVGLIVQKDKTEWADFHSPDISDSRYEIELKLIPETDTVYQQYKMISTAYEALKFRKQFSSNYDDLAENLLGNDYKSFDSIRANNLTEVEEPFELDFSKATALEKVEDKLLIDPFCEMVTAENPLKQPNRTYPVDFTYKWSKSFSITIQMPEGYQLLSKPDNLIVNNKMICIVYTIDDQTPGLIKIVGQYKFKKDVYEVTDYANLKGYYNMIVSKFNEKIVLVKNEI